MTGLQHPNRRPGASSADSFRPSWLTVVFIVLAIIAFATMKRYAARPAAALAERSAVQAKPRPHTLDQKKNGTWSKPRPERPRRQIP